MVAVLGMEKIHTYSHWSLESLMFNSFGNLSQVDKQLEAELREMHAVVSDQQKRLDTLTLENERLRQELHDRHQVSSWL